MSKHEDPKAYFKEDYDKTAEDAESLKKQMAGAKTADEMMEIAMKLKAVERNENELMGNAQEEAGLENKRITKEKEEAAARAKELEELKLKDETESAEKAEEIKKKMKGEGAEEKPIDKYDNLLEEDRKRETPEDLRQKSREAQILEKSENEGRTENLESYIKLHKEINLPIKEIVDQSFKNEIFKNKGLSELCILGRTPESFNLDYIDSEGNSATVDIVLSKINSMSALSKQVQSEVKKHEKRSILGKLWKSNEFWEKQQEIGEEIKRELKKLDFVFVQKKQAKFWRRIKGLRNGYQEKLEEKTKEKKKGEFDF